MKKIFAMVLTLLLLVGFFAPQAMAWGPKVHNYAARLIVEELNELKIWNSKEYRYDYRLKLPSYDGMFSVPRVFGDAIIRYPQAFYAGSLGPDLYPDLFAGPNWVHDDDSMPWLKTMIDHVNSMPAGAQKDMAMAFTLGFMSHYCADMFGSDYLGSLASGQRYSSLPLANALHATPAIIVYARNMALRTGFDERINDTYNKTDVKAPVDFVMQNLIYDGATNNGVSKHYKTVPVQFGYLVKFRSIIHSVSETVKKVPGLGAAASIFTEKWINQFDKAVVKYVEASNVVAQRILMSHASELSETHIFVEEISEWVENYGATISPIPKIGGGDDNNKGMLDKVKSFVLNLVSKAFGYEDFRSLVVGVVFKVFDGFDTAVSRTLQHRFPGTKIDSFYAMLKEPGRPLFDSGSVLSDFARDAAVLKADSAAGTGAADQNMVPLYNSLTMMKLMLIGPENYQVLLNRVVNQGSITSAYQMVSEDVKVNRISITIHTANEKYAGTDDNIYLHISDDKGNSYKNKVLLDKANYDDFERNATDSYEVDLGADIPLSSLRFKLENSYVLFKDDWKVGWVEIVPYMGSAPISKASAGQVNYNTWLTNKNKTLTLSNYFTTTGLSYSSPLHAGILPKQLALDGTRQWRHLQLWGDGVQDSEQGNRIRRALFFRLFKGYSPSASFTLTSRANSTDPATRVDQTINRGDTLTIDAQLINHWNGVPATRREQKKILASSQNYTYKAVTGELTYTFISSSGRVSETATIDPIGVVLMPVQKATLSYSVPMSTNVGDTIRIIATYEGDDWNAPATYEVATLRVVDDHQYELNVENGTIDGTDGDTTGLYARDTQISVTADVPQENTYFVGWEGEGIELTAEQKARTTLEFTMPESDVTVTACYEVVPESSDSTEYYALSVVNGTGSGVFEEGDVVTITADDPGNGEVFAGWESNGIELTEAQRTAASFELTMPGNDVVIVARYTQSGTADTTKYRVSVVNGTGGGLYAPGAQVTVEADVQPDKHFIGWESDEISLTQEQKADAHLTFTMPDNDVTLIACYEEESEEDVEEDDPQRSSYMLSVMNGTGSGVYAEGAKIEVKADAPGSDEKFAGWQSLGIDLTEEQQMRMNLSITMPGNDVLLIACYETDEDKPEDTTAYRVSVINGTGSGVYQAGVPVTATALDLSDMNLKFVGWESDDVSLTGENVSPVTFTMPKNDVTLIACYESLEEDEPEDVLYPLSVVGGTGDGLYKAGERVTITANKPKAGTSFAGWTSSDYSALTGVTEISYTFTMPAQAVTVTATYSGTPTDQTYYQLSVINGTGDGLYEAGKQVTITANAPKAGWGFKKWSSSNYSDAFSNVTEISYTFTMPAQDVTVTAEYEPLQSLYVLTVVNGMGDGVYAARTSVTVKANVAPNGWRFERWESDGAALTTQEQKEPEFNFTMPANDVTLTALYVQEQSDDPDDDPSDSPDDDPLDGPEEDPDDQTYYSVTVINGTGDGVYRPGETVTVNLIETGETEFIGWQFINAEDEELLDDRMQKSFTFTMPARNVMIIGAFQFDETLHHLVVVNGTGDGVYMEGAQVEVAAYSEADMHGAKFVRWESDEIFLTDEQMKNPNLTLTMPGWDVVLTAVFEEVVPTETTYHVEVIGGEGSGDYKAREMVVIAAGEPPQPGMYFTGWTSDQMDLIKLYPEMTADMELLAFYMPECDVTIVANYDFLPPTGDDSSLYLWSALAAGSLFGAALLMRRSRRKARG